MKIFIKSVYSIFVIPIVLLIVSMSVKAQTEKFSYGLTLGLNYPTIGAQYDIYSGQGNPTLGMFILYRPETGIGIGHPSKNKTYTLVSDEFARRLSFILQPSFSSTGFREINADRRYNNYYLELSGLMYIQPFAFIDEFNFFIGIQPSILTSYNTELFVNGFYTNQSYDANLNTVKQLNFCVPFGLSIALSQAVWLEASYIHSFTNQNTSQIIKGRPSSIELTLRLNALGLLNQFSKKEDLLRKQINTLSKGSLLVMLPTPNPGEINKLKAENNKKEIALINQELVERNKKVMREFKSYFDFCHVYFFMDTSAYKIISKNFNNVFVNSELTTDPMIKPDSSNFFVASFCNDNSAYTTKNQYGLFVYDDHINQLPKPFNVPTNLIGANLEGDPINFFKKKRYNYSIVSFEKIITRFNNRMLRYKD